MTLINMDNPFCLGRLDTTLSVPASNLGQCSVAQQGRPSLKRDLENVKVQILKTSGILIESWENYD